MIERERVIERDREREREREKERDLYIERKEYKQQIISERKEKFNSKTKKNFTYDGIFVLIKS